VGALREEAARRMRAAGVETPALDADLLLGLVLERDRAWLHAHPEAPVGGEEAARFEEAVARRAAREPLPYLLGAWEFLGMRFRVTPVALIPRPETETLVERAAERLPANARVLEVGAGSGCVSAGLARLLPEAEVLALEPSPAAALLARENVAALGFGERVRVIEAAFPAGARRLGVFDGVVSNPPYVPTAEIERLQPEVRLYEPRAALDGGPDGLRLLRALAGEAPALLRPGGLLAVEVGAGQAEAVLALLGRDPWREAQSFRDLAGAARVVVARKARAA
jgi:release factor glutamine methyltransferase